MHYPFANILAMVAGLSNAVARLLDKSKEHNDVSTAAKALQAKIASEQVKAQELYVLRPPCCLFHNGRTCVHMQLATTGRRHSELEREVCPRAWSLEGDL